jgi:hypothetical protein
LLVSNTPEILRFRIYQGACCKAGSDLTLENRGSLSGQEAQAEAELLALEKRRILHDLRQPISVITIVIANVRRRCVPALDDDLSPYLDGKLKQLDEQVARLAEQIDVLGDFLQSGD